MMWIDNIRKNTFSIKNLGTYKNLMNKYNFSWLNSKFSILSLISNF